MAPSKCTLIIDATATRELMDFLEEVFADRPNLREPFVILMFEEPNTLLSFTGKPVNETTIAFSLDLTDRGYEFLAIPRTDWT